MSSTVSGANIFPFKLDAEAMTEERENSDTLRGEEFKCLQKIKKDVIEMVKSSDMQKNVNRTINDGLKNLMSYID